MLNVCIECSTLFSIGAEACPHCGSEDFMEEGTMAKITVHGGATNAAAAVAAVVAAVSEEPDAPAETEAVVVEDPSAEESVVEPAPEGDEAVDPYADWSLAELQEEATARGLAKSGTKADIAARLTEDDAQTGGPEDATDTVPEAEPTF